VGDWSTFIISSTDDRSLKLLYAISGYWGYNISRNPFGMKEKIGEVEIYDEKNI